jgi:hypothetical protein
VPDDYRDSRLLNYDDLFRAWEQYLRFQVGGAELDRTPGDGADAAASRTDDTD